MTKHVAPKTLTDDAVAALLAQADGETVRKLVQIMSRDRVLVGCIGEYQDRV